MILLFNDFGAAGPYVGQMKSALNRLAPDSPVIDLMHDVPHHSVQSGAYLLGALFEDCPPESIIVAVVDPGVGSDQREPAVLEVADRCIVGPGNGLFSNVVQRAEGAQASLITWRPERISKSFHGRDLFAPIAAQIAHGQIPLSHACDVSTVTNLDWPPDLPQVIYIDGFGNAMTGIRAATISENEEIRIRNVPLVRASTFADVSSGSAMWYENSLGLVEIAVNKGRADQELGLSIGLTISTVKLME